MTNKYSAILDSLGIYGAKYAFPANSSVQCFLLDGENEVVWGGNPAVNTEIKNLYLKYILEHR